MGFCRVFSLDSCGGEADGEWGVSGEAAEIAEAAHREAVSQKCKDRGSFIAINGTLGAPPLAFQGWAPSCRGCANPLTGHGLNAHTVIGTDTCQTSPTAFPSEAVCAVATPPVVSVTLNACWPPHFISIMLRVSSPCGRI